MLDGQTSKTEDMQTGKRTEMNNRDTRIRF